MEKKILITGIQKKLDFFVWLLLFRYVVLTPQMSCRCACYWPT